MHWHCGRCNKLNRESRNVCRSCHHSHRPMVLRRSFYHNKVSPTSILNVALDIHMVCNGSMEVVDVGGWIGYAKMISVLRYTLDHWEPSMKMIGMSFDASVRSLIKTTLQDHLEFMQRHPTINLEFLLSDPLFFNTKDEEN